MAITTNLRTTLIEWINLNQGRDFSDVGAWNVTNTLGFTDVFSDLNLTPTGTWNLILSRWESFVAYVKDNDNAFLKCQLTQNYNQPFAEPDGTYFLWIEVVSALVTTWSAQLDGSDMFTIEWGAALPVSWFYYPLFEFSKTWSNIAIVNDLRVKRNVQFNDAQFDGDVNIDWDLTVAGTTNLTDQTFINWDQLNQYITDTVAATSGWSFTKDFVLGEDFTNVGPRNWTMFLGKGQTSFDSLTQNGLQVFWDVAATEKVRLKLDNTIDSGSMNLATFSFWIGVIGTPVDNIEFQLFEGTTVVDSDITLLQTTVDWTQQIHATGRAWFSSNTVDRYIEIRRTGVLDAINYYTIERDNTASVSWASYEIRDGATWNIAAWVLRFTAVFGFQKDLAYKSDPRGPEAEDVRGKALQLWVAWETKTFYIGGMIDHVAASTDLEYKEHILVDKILDNIQVDSYGDFLLGASGTIIMAGDGGPSERVGQTITMVEDYFYKIDVNITTQNNPTDWVLARMYDSPGGTLLATSKNIIDSSDILPYSPITPRPLLTFEFDWVNVWVGGSVYIELDRTWARDVSNNYFVSDYSWTVPFPAYAGWTAYQVNSWTPLASADDLIFISYQSATYTKDTWLYDINKGEPVIETWTWFYIWNQISNGLFSLEIVEEQQDKQIKQIDVVNWTVIWLWVWGLTIAHNLWVRPSNIQAVFTPQELWTNQTSVWSSNWIWANWVQSCVYSYWNWSSWVAFNNWVDTTKAGVLKISRIAALTNIEIISVDKDTITLDVTWNVFSWFYHLVLNK